MIVLKKDLKLYKDQRLLGEKGVGHFFTTRFGGFSGRDGNLFNVSFGKEKDEAAAKVLKNVAVAAAAEELPFERFTAVRQVHGDRILKVTEDIAGAGFGKRELVIEADAMITDLPMTPLLTTHGDCVPVYIYGRYRAVGMVHSGWRGTALGIAGKTAEAMCREYGIRPEELVCAIGPSICKKCFEIDRPVFDELRAVFGDESLYDFDPLKNKYYADLGGMVFRSLVTAGVRPENVSFGGLCTCCEENKDLFFSHRREKGRNEGLMGACIWLTGD